MKDFFGSIFGIVLILIGSIGYINNIIWLFDNWSYIEWINKGFHLVSIVMFPPLGCIIGIIHLF